MNRRQMFSTGAKLLAGLAGFVITQQLPADKPVPINLKRCEQPEEIHIFFRTENGKRFQDYVVKTVTDDIQRNGPTRKIISRMAGR